MPDWRAVTRSVAQRVGIHPDLFERQIDQESGFNPNAGSPAGAKGIAQIVPEYHPGVDPYDPYAALTYAAKWMKELHGQYGNWRDALVAYNGGGRAVERWKAGKPFEESLAYVNAILGPGKAEAAELDQPAPTGGATVASPTQVPAPPELQAVERVKGSPVSIRPRDEYIADPQDPTGPKIKNPSPTYRFLFKDGTYLDVKSEVDLDNPQSGQAAAYVVVGGTALASVAAQDKPKPTDKPTVIGGNSPSERYIVRQMPDGSISRESNPNYTPPATRTPAKPNNKQVVTRNGKSYIYDPDTNTFSPATGLPDEEKAPAKPTVHTIGGRIYTVDADGNVVKTADVRTPEEVQAAGLGVKKTQQDLTEGALDIEKKKRDLLPKQQQVIQGHYDTIKYVQGMLERGELEPSEANAYITASRAAAEAALQGATPFELKKSEDDAARARQRMGVDVLNQRIATTGTIGSSLLSAASSLGSRAMLRPGQTSIGFNPLADTLSFMGQASQQAQMDPAVAALLAGAGPGGAPQGLPPGAPSGLVPVQIAGSMPGAAR